jgi:hypothetical protein
MTSEEEINLRNAIKANPDCAPYITAKDPFTIAKIMSVGLKRPTDYEIGNGRILQVLGITVGSAFLDVINSNDVYRYVRPLLETGRFLIGAPEAQAAVQAFVPAVLTQEQADAICDLGMESYEYSAQEISNIMFNDDGSEK